MGRFFTSAQIYNPKILSQKEFIDMFCKEINKVGYMPCNSDDSELSYMLKFTDNCKWVTITSDAYEQGNQFAQQDTGRIAKMLKTTCINSTVIDSDCAVLDLYDESGKKADSLILGRADDYFGDDIPQPCEKIWKSFLSNCSTWEQFTEICNTNEVFVEDILSKLAKIIGMDSSNILFSVEDTQEDEQTVFLYFKKTETKREKKLTLNAAFRQVFGEALEPLGFLRIKSKHPYFMRVVNGDILHIITYRTEQAQYPEDKAFSVIGGVATVYRKKIDLSIGIKNNYNWLRSSIGDFYARSVGAGCDNYYRQTISNFYYFSEIEKSMLSALNDALKLTKKYVLPILDDVDTLEKSIEFFERFRLPIDTSAFNTDLCFDGDSDYNEGFLYIKTDYQKLKEKWRRIVEGEDIVLPELSEKVTELYKFFIDSAFKNAVLEELEKRKKFNIEALKSYGTSIA